MHEQKILDFKAIGDERGYLISLEENKQIPFEVKRVYYIYGTQKNIIRGKHAHRKLQQIIFCPKGSCDFTLDNGIERKTIHLNSPAQGIHIKHNIWREFTNFSPDCIVVVLASDLYDENDYIRNYDDFLKEVKNNG